MKPEVWIRTDGHAQMGLGHLVRCQALAHMINDDFDITFCCRDIPEPILKDVRSNGFSYMKVESEDEFTGGLKNNMIVVLDGYHFDTGYQKRIKATGARLVCIDDLHEIEFTADLIINHVPGISARDYRAQPYTQFALGPDYALLRPAFLEQARSPKPAARVDTVLICFGGSDHKNLTQSTLQVASKFLAFKKIIVVTGSAYQPSDSFKQVVAGDNRIDYRQGLTADEMRETMTEAGLAIVPASGILFEVLAAGCIAISGTYVHNQELVYSNFLKAGAVLDAGNFSDRRLKGAITKALAGLGSRVRLIDGQTSERIQKIFDQLQKEFSFGVRRATHADLDLTFHWASDPEIRRYSFQKHLITKPEHTKWFLNILSDPDCYYFLAEYNGVPVGSIRFDIREGEAIVSYLIDTEYHGQGLGLLLLKTGIAALMKSFSKEPSAIRLISGEVLKNNIPSVKAFERLGFNRIERSGNYKFEKWIS